MEDRRIIVVFRANDTDEAGKNSSRARISHARHGISEDMPATSRGIHDYSSRLLLAAVAKNIDMII